MRLLAVLNVLFKYAWRAKRLAPRPDGPLTHFVSPRGEKCRLGVKPHGHAALTSYLGDPLYDFPPRPEYIIVKKNDIRYQLAQFRVLFWIDPAPTFCVTIDQGVWQRPFPRSENTVLMRQKCEKLKTLPRELFQFDQTDLDFGSTASCTPRAPK